jgi:RNA polymerase sigma factor (sigma-70 family)
MAAVSLTSMLHRLSALAVDERSDGQLLQRFISTADDNAFAALVRRHGRLVHGVCRRVLGSGTDVDDAFQATFLVLARKAGSIRNQASVASWLYGVAYRMAAQVKGQRGRSRQREQSLDGGADNIAESNAMQVDPATRASLRELGAILDEELQRLPAGCRDALVLTFLEGLSHTEASQQLGWALGTFKGRVQRGRQLLRERLQRRGLTLSMVGLCVLLAEQAGTAAPAALVRTTVRAVTGKALSARVAALADVAVRTLTIAKVKLAMFALCAAGLLGMGAAALPVAPAQAPGGNDPSAQFAAVQTKDAPTAKDQLGDPLPPGALARLGTVRLRHAAPVSFLALTPDGKRVISAAGDRYVRIWDAATGQELHRFGPGPKVEAPPTGGMGQVVLVFGPDQPVVAALSADGKLVAARFDRGEIEVREVATGKKVAGINPGNNGPNLGDLAGGAIGALAFSPDGKQLALASTNGTVRLWDFETGKIARHLGKAPNTGNVVIFGGGGGGEAAAVYAPDGKTLAASQTSNDDDIGNRLLFWEPQTGKEIRSLKVAGQSGVAAAAFSRDGKLFAYATDDAQVVILRAESGEVLHTFKVAKSPGRPALAFAPDGSKLLVRSFDPGAVQEWDVTTGKQTREVAKVAGPGSGFAVSADGKTAVVAGGGRAISFIDIAAGKVAAAPEGHSNQLLQLNYTEDGKTVWTGGADGTRRLWDAATGKLLKQVPVSAMNKGFATSADGRYTAHRDAKTNIKLVDDTTGKTVATIAGPDAESVPALARPACLFAPDGHTLLVRWPEQPFATLYDVPSGKERCRVPTAAAGQTAPQFLFTPDGRRVAVSGASSALTVYDTTTGKVLHKVPLPEKVAVRGAAFSPDGRALALDRGDGTVQLVELATGKDRRTVGQKAPPPKGGMMGGAVFVVDMPGGGGGGIRAAATVAFSPDGRLMAHSGLDRVLRVYDVATGQMVAQFEGHTGPISAFSFAPDGRSVATASGDTTALVWDLREPSAKAGPVPQVLDVAAVQARWKDLAADDAVAARDAMNALVGSPQQAVTFLTAQLKPAVAVEPAAIIKLVEQLDHSEFKVRQQAQAELLQIGDQAVPYLEEALKRQISLESRRRLEHVHFKLTTAPLSGSRLQLVRAVEVLERIGGGEAQKLLQTLAAGAPGALPTTQARAALERMK